MKNLIIEPYTAADDQAALDLEKQCIQGRSLALSFVRPAFQARSQVYEKYKIFCAKSGKDLIGIFAAAEKCVKLNGQSVRSLYFYDCRIHPEFRHKGIAKMLTEALLEYFGDNIDCYYTFIAGQNKRAFELAASGFGAQVIIPLKYIIIPVYKKYTSLTPIGKYPVEEVHNNYLQKRKGLEFIPELNRHKLKGYVDSYADHKMSVSGSVWTNENLLNERVEKIPFHFQFYRMLSRLLSPFIKMPKIPSNREIIKSWFLFDLYANNSQSLAYLLENVNNKALEHGKNYIYMLLNEQDPVFSLIKETKFKYFELPYIFLAKGPKIPQVEDNLYIDIRDL